MKKILSVVGARPQIIKAAAFSRAVRTRFSSKIQEVIVHTGQHYDTNMSDVFFTEMGIPRPNYNLNVGSESHGKQTAAMISGIEEILMKEKPDCVLVYGDTNSTLAASISASKMHIPIIHVEAGLRSFSKKMPEEINRVLCDHISTLLFCPTENGFENLMKEGFLEGNKPPYSFDNPRVFRCGDVMYDNSIFFSAVAETRVSLLDKLGLSSKKFLLATIHRDYNTDVSDRLNAIFSAFLKIVSSSEVSIVIPLHPRTKKVLEEGSNSTLYHELKATDKIKIISPVSFLEMILLEKHCSMVLTDSGGVQKESFFFKKPCIILRSETEWIELVENGNAILADANEKSIVAAFETFSIKSDFTYPAFYGTGNTAEFICEEILKFLESSDANG